MSKARIAVLKGTFAVPGVSRNRRWYKPEHIAGAVAEAQGLIDSGNAPVVSMLTHHGARHPSTGDVTRTAGRITKVGLSPEGHGTFEADLADTQAGRDVAALTTPDQPYLKGVSMASLWKGTPRVENGPDGDLCETADGFSLKGIDFTHNPGIPDARIHSAELAEAADTGMIFESIDEAVFVETVEPEPANYADPGYQADKKKRYPLPDAAHCRSAWSYINVPKNADKYTPAQLKRIKSKIKAAAKKFGVDISEESEVLAFVHESLGDDFTAVMEAYTVPSDSGVEADDGNDMGPECPACGADLPSDAQFCPSCGQPISSTESAPAESIQTESETSVSTSTETTGAANETVTLSKDDLAKMVQESSAAAVKEALEAAKAAEVTESEKEAQEKEAREAAIADARKLVAEADGTTETVTESFSAEDVKKMVTEAAEAAAKTATEAALDLARKEIQESGPRRHGLVSQQVLEQGPEAWNTGEKPLDTASLQELEKMTDDAYVPFFAR